MKLGFTTWGTQHLPLDETIEHLGRIGYDGVEIAILPGWSGCLDELDTAERRRIRQLLDQHGLELPALVSAHRNQIADGEEYRLAKARYEREIALALEWAGDEGVPALDVAVGGRSEEWELIRHKIVDRVGETVATAARHGVVVALEPHVGQAIDTPAKMLWVLDQIRSPFCKVNFDISHFNVQGIAIEESVSLIGPHAVHTHIKDERGIAPDHEFLIPGEGEFDYVRYLEAMATVGYTGHITVEISLMVQRRPHYDPIAAMQRSYDVVNAAFDAASLGRA